MRENSKRWKSPLVSPRRHRRDEPAAPARRRAGGAARRDKATVREVRASARALERIPRSGVWAGFEGCRKPHAWPRVCPWGCFISDAMVTPAMYFTRSGGEMRHAPACFRAPGRGSCQVAVLAAGAGAAACWLMWARASVTRCTDQVPSRVRADAVWLEASTKDHLQAFEGEELGGRPQREAIGAQPQLTQRSQRRGGRPSGRTDGAGAHGLARRGRGSPAPRSSPAPFEASSTPSASP